MKLQELIAQHLTEVHEGNNWTGVNLRNTLEDVTWEEASQLSGFSANTIAMLVSHITFWNEAVMLRGKGIKPEITEDNGFHSYIVNSAPQWEQLKHKNMASARELAEVVHNFDDKKLFLPILSGHTTAYKNFQGQVEHVHYHLGQIVMVKKAVKSKPAP